MIRYHWNENLSTVILLRETESSPITCIVRKRLLWLYEHVELNPEVDFTLQIVFVRDKSEWRIPTVMIHLRACTKAVCDLVLVSVTLALDPVVGNNP